MARVAVKVSCTDNVMKNLERMSNSRSGEVRMAERARIVLACLKDKRNDEIARELGTRANTVGMWHRRFAEHGMEGLQDKGRPGQPTKYGTKLRDRVLAQLELPAPEGMSSWDGGSLASVLEVSAHAIWRVLRKEGIQLHGALVPTPNLRQRRPT